VGADRAYSTLLVFGILILKVLLVSKGDLYTALGVVEASGVVAVMVGAALSILPFAALALLGFGLYASVSQVPFRLGLGRRPGRQGVYALFVLFACFILTPLYILPRAVLIAVAGGLLERLVTIVQEPWPTGHPDPHAVGRNRPPLPSLLRADRERGVRRLLRITTVVLSLMVIYNGILFAMWLPHEALYAPDRSQPVIVGYVLDDSNGWTSILTAGDRKLLRVASDTITARVVCLKAYHESALQALLRRNGIPRPPPCPPVRERIEQAPAWFGRPADHP
jgi:hypothetical protein